MSINETHAEIHIEDEELQNWNNCKELIKQLKKMKRPESGGIYEKPKLKNYPQLFTKCLNGEEITEKWKTVVFTSIHKKANKKEYNSNCRVTVTITVCRE